MRFLATMRICQCHAFSTTCVRNRMLSTQRATLVAAWRCSSTIHGRACEHRYHVFFYFYLFKQAETTRTKTPLSTRINIAAATPGVAAEIRDG